MRLARVATYDDDDDPGYDEYDVEDAAGLAGGGRPGGGAGGGAGGGGDGERSDEDESYAESAMLVEDGKVGGARVPLWCKLAGFSDVNVDPVSLLVLAESA